MSIIEVTVMERRQLKTKPPVGKILVYAGLVIWALIVLFPFYWMLLSSVKSYSAYNSEFIPQLYTLSPTLQNYVDAFTTVPLAPKNNTKASITIKIFLYFFSMINWNPTRSIHITIVNIICPLHKDNRKLKRKLVYKAFFSSFAPTLCISTRNT